MTRSGARRVRAAGEPVKSSQRKRRDEFARVRSTRGASTEARTDPAEAVRAAQGRAHLTDWRGHFGYFANPDGHAWEVVRNPFSCS